MPRQESLPHVLRLLICLISFAFVLPAAADVVRPSAIAAIKAADGGAWDTGYALADRNDTVTRDVITWLRLRAGRAPFPEYQEFLARRSDWPRQTRLRARGEEMLPKGTDPAIVLSWFADFAPETGEGAVRLAEALYARGQPRDAEKVIAAAWVDLRLTETGETAMLEAFPDLLDPLHPARTDALLWRWRTEEATRMLPRLPEDQRALAAARLAYIQKAGDLDEKLEAVPDALRDNPGLVYDRYNWLASRGNRAEAVALIRARSSSAESLGQPFRWSGWRRALARWEMREGRPERAYDVASKHFLSEGSSFADLEWLSGYLALTYLGTPAVALNHFETALAAVDSPISLGRMHYWVGRAQDVLGNTQSAINAYTRAAQYQTSFYGLLAAEKLGLSLDPALTGRTDPVDWEGADVLNDDLVKAALTLLRADERGAAVSFFVEVGKRLSADDLARLGALLDTWDEDFYTVLLGKTAVTQGRLVPSIYYPIHPMAEMDLPVDMALALSVARRESEFNAGVGSPVGALGLMQLMPATAEEVAGFLGLPYSRARLTNDWAYNAQLGSKYLAVLQEQFGPSPVQIAAGYNAGPSRPVAWMQERGDPRDGTVDVIDWIEHIPFRETRNYVMRVTESIPIYEARLTGRTGQIRFTAMLVGEQPVIRPALRPDDLGVTPPISGLRPVGRPVN